MILPQEQLRRALQAAVKKAYPAAATADITIEPTKDRQFGDFSSNVAMRLGPILQQPPLEVAQHVLAQLGTHPMLAKAEAVAPGFMNFSLEPSWLLKQTDKILTGKNFGSSTEGKDRKIVAEFISANPTGPMTLGNGRGAFAGDTLGNVFTMTGWKVTREYYVNDIGNQVNILAESVIRRYFQLHNIPTEYPDYCYQGEYISELAAQVKLDSLKIQDISTVRDRIKIKVLNLMIKEIQRVVTKKLKITFDSWMKESNLYTKKLDAKALDTLRSHDLLYDKDGATWFRTTAFSDDKDRVLIKKDGEKTYFLSDVALRIERFHQRKFEREILILGADHHGYIGRLQAAFAALGLAGRQHILIVQLVRLIRGGEEVKMSKRAGTYVALEELIDEVGVDVARFFFLMHSANTHMDFDLDAAKEKSEKNPVYYVQYAHARLSSILKKTKKLPLLTKPESIDQSEVTLGKTLLLFPDIIANVSREYSVHQLPFYAIELATHFHDFYTRCRVIDANKVWAHRLRLVEATKLVLGKTLGVMGVTAPEKM